MEKQNSQLITTAEAAVILGFSQDHVRRLILTNRIKAIKFGKTWLIRKGALARVKRRRMKGEET